MAKGEGNFGVTGFPTRPGNGLIKASSKFKVPKVPKAKGRRTQLGTAPQANGRTITGASTSTSRIGY